MNRLDPAIRNAKSLCGLSAERPPAMPMEKHICVLQEALQDLLRELNDALVVANEGGYQRGYDDGYSDASRDVKDIAEGKSLTV